MRRVLAVLSLFGVAGLAWADPANGEFAYKEPKFEVNGGFLLGGDTEATSVVGLTVSGAVFPTDHWGLEGWLVPAGGAVQDRATPELENELGPVVSFYQHWGFGLVSRWRLTVVEPSIFNVLASAGWHRASLDRGTMGDSEGSPYLGLGAQLILGRPFVLSARIRWLPVDGPSNLSGRSLVQLVGAVGVVF